MIERTSDVSYICSIAKHPRVWPWISEDQDTPEQYLPEIDRTVYLKFEGGYMSFKPFTRACWECHICALPKTKDIPAKVEACLAWMARRGVGRFLAKMAQPNRHAIALAKRMGFKDCGKVHASCMRGGKLVDVVLMEYDHGSRR